MNQPSNSIHELIDRLTRSKANFAFYRQPWTDEPVLVLQGGGATQLIDDLPGLNGKTGFVLAPFRQATDRPIVLIRPDKVVREWEAISETLEEYVRTCPDILPEQVDHTSLPTTDDALGAVVEDKKGYEEAFGRFLETLKKKQFQKLVLSRTARVSLPENFSPLTAFVNACNSYPRMMVSLCHTPATGTWLGSTPEIILSGHDTQWHTVSLAGTMPMQGDTMPDDWSEKNRREQELVSEYIRRTIRQFGSKVDEKGPYTARAGQLVHLKTDFAFQLKDTSRLGNILGELHPTPAVCGLPKQEAYAFIGGNEGYDRKYYAGIIGWLDPQGDTSLYVNLRCMQIAETVSTLYAGGGMLASSTLEAEWEETRQKLRTMLHII